MLWCILLTENKLRADPTAVYIMNFIKGEQACHEETHIFVYTFAVYKIKIEGFVCESGKNSLRQCSNATFILANLCVYRH